MTTSAVRLEPVGDTAVLRVEYGKANALDTELCQELISWFTDLEASEYTSVVLTGNGSMFSAGVDLPRLRAGGSEYLREFLPMLSDTFLTLFGYPGPVVAALDGHAIAGGAVLAAACDYRVGNVERGRIGVTELLVGVPLPISALEILRYAFGSRSLTELTTLGKTYPADEALAAGLINEATEPSKVHARAVDVAETLGKIPPAVFGHNKAQIRAPYSERIGEQRGIDDPYVERLWDAPETRAAIDAYMAASMGRRE